MQIDAPARTVHVLLVGGDGGSNNGFNFDGYGRGELTVRVPRGWTVKVTCRNSGPSRSSCAVVSGPGATTPAFPGASTTSPVVGLASGEAESFQFRAARVGTYRLASLVPGQELARMFDVLVVTSGGRPSITARPGP